jgi:uncharacterized membrane protein YraQ (UPF0718 family)/copper chaperone CopZ
VPVATSLQKRGANKGATIAFMTSTPQIGADSFLMTYSLLGPLFAVFRISASLITALVSGIAVNTAVRIPDVNDTNRSTLPINANAAESIKNKLHNLPRYIEFEVLGPIAGTLITGIIAAGLISTFLPEWLFVKYLGNSWLSMFVMLAAGIPLYVCASASTPIAASLVLKGMSPGAALVFLLTGPATNAVTITTVVKTLGKRAAFYYVASIAVVSIFLGHILNVVIGSGFGITAIRGEHHMAIPNFIETGSSIVLGLMLLYYFASKYRKPTKTNTDIPAIRKVVLKVNGMTCSHCSETVRKTVESVHGTKEIIVNLANGNVSFEAQDSGTIETVKKRIQEEGFDCP